VGVKGSGTEMNGEMWNPGWLLQDNWSRFEIAVKAEMAFTLCMSNNSEDLTRLNSEVWGISPSVGACSCALVIWSDAGGWMTGKI
jgi:hypothetical protein